MKLFIRTAITLAVLTSVSFLSSVHANSTESINAKNESDYSFLYPGFHFDIQPVAEGDVSISALYDGEGFILCTSQPDPSNEVVTAPFHCNSRLTPIGFHITPQALFGKTGFWHKLKSVAEAAAIAVPQAAAALTNIPGASIPAQAATNVTQQSTAAEVVAQYQLSKTMDKIKLYAQEGESECDSTFPTVPAAFFMADLYKDIQDRERSFEKTCAKYPLTIDIKDSKYANDSEAHFCHEQNENNNYASNIISLCNIQPVTAQTGEGGGTELWYPGQPVSASCIKTLMQDGARDSQGNPILDPKTGWNVQPAGAVLITWLKKEQDQLNKISPNTTDAAVAQHVGQCLANNPAASSRLQGQLKKAEADLPGLVVTPDPATASSATSSQ